MLYKEEKTVPCLRLAFGQVWALAAGSAGQLIEAGGLPSEVLCLGVEGCTVKQECRRNRPRLLTEVVRESFTEEPAAFEGRILMEEGNFSRGASGEGVAVEQQV